MANITMTATADFAGFKEGQKLSKPGDIAKYFRAALDMDGDGNELPEDQRSKLTDPQILAAVNSVQGDNADAEEKRMDLLTALNEASSGDTGDTGEQEADGDASDVTGDDATTDDDKPGSDDKPEDEIPSEKQSDVLADAIKTARPFAEDTETQEHIRGVLAAGRKIKMGPLIMMLDIRRLMPNAQERMALPQVGTSWKDRKPGESYPVDRRRILVRGAKGLKPVTVSTYDLMFGQMPIGKELQTAIDMIENRKLAGKSNQYTIWKDHDAEGEHDTLVGDRTQGRTLFKRGWKLDRQFLLCEELDTKEGVKVSWKTGRDGKPENTRYSIVVRDNRDGTASRYSIDQFLGFDVAKAKDPAYVADKGSIFGALVSSGGEGGGTPETPQIAAMDIDMFMAEAGMLASYMTNPDNRALVKRRMFADTDEGRKFMVTIVDMVNELREWTVDPVILKRYEQETGERKAKPAKAA